MNFWEQGLYLIELHKIPALAKSVLKEFTVFVEFD
jgi:hypothetical protein